MEKEKIEELASKLNDLVNNFNCEGDCALLVNRMANNHRTLQQNTMRYIIAPLILMWADSDCDERNKDTVELCRELKPIVERAHFAFI